MPGSYRVSSRHRSTNNFTHKPATKQQPMRGSRRAGWRSEPLSGIPRPSCCLFTTTLPCTASLHTYPPLRWPCDPSLKQSSHPCTFECMFKIFEHIFFLPTWVWQSPDVFFHSFMCCTCTSFFESFGPRMPRSGHFVYGNARRP